MAEQCADRWNMATPTLRKALDALDTAAGCLMLVADDRKPIDLAECREEIDMARDALAMALGDRS